MSDEERQEYEPPEITVIATVAEATLGTQELLNDMGPLGS
ncbi:MAG TPA: lasso RiPP family leader peptide-containing protein [Thermoleophilaceae bacterium]|nr:lasso RiPP family leader peptide-containing protein [Thermoleophilaceae bacterium]